MQDWNMISDEVSRTYVFSGGVRLTYKEVIWLKKLKDEHWLILADWRHIYAAHWLVLEIKYKSKGQVPNPNL